MCHSATYPKNCFSQKQALIYRHILCLIKRQERESIMKSAERSQQTRMKEIVSILMESAFYLEMPLHERKMLIESLLIS